MQVSQKSKEPFDACRFCWMCHHICPIGNATGHERNTARARALSLSLVERGGLALDEEVSSNLYECALCSGCAHDCITGWDPTKFTKEARLAAALEGVLPPYINTLLDNIADYGTPYGKVEENADLKKAIAALPKTAEVLLFLGADARALYPDCSLADLYDEVAMPPELRKAHQENDKAVMRAYGFWGKLNTESECVAELMKLYQNLTEV